MRIYYGLLNNSIDITDICMLRLKTNNTIVIPHGDKYRDLYFSDPLYGTHKNIIITFMQDTKIYDEYTTIKINLDTNEIKGICLNDINSKISMIYEKLQLKYGNFSEEIQEQKMIVRYLQGEEKVLEIGGNIGRNSILIANIIKNDNFVSLECYAKNAFQIIENRNLNKFTFSVECATLFSQTELSEVNVITYTELQSKYNIIFDTLIITHIMEFYYIIINDTSVNILTNINLLILKNDYNNNEYKENINNVLFANNFYTEYVEPVSWNLGPCYNNFYEVWKRALL